VKPYGQELGPYKRKSEKFPCGCRKHNMRHAPEHIEERRSERKRARRENRRETQESV